MAKAKNVLFIMCDQLRADYLSCYGHPHLKTPHIDTLAARGTRFTRAYVQAPVCGPSRMSTYTGRYSMSHGATWNFVPLPVGERTLGDYLRPHGVRTALIGKTHMKPDEEGMARLGLSHKDGDGLLVSECGFEPYARDDGIYFKADGSPEETYNRYLNRMGYPGTNPWHDYANSGEGPNGEVLSGWNMRNAPHAARAKEEHTETAFCTDQAMAFMTEQGDKPWCLHLSFIKPHWPYIAPAPYHAMFGEGDIIPAVKSEEERRDANPVYGAFMKHQDSQSFAREEVRKAVIPTYMGLVKQIDDHLGRLFRHMEASGRMSDTLIVLTADHGDFLGDHWLGEKEMFYEQSARVPMIVVDPDDAAPRGVVSDDLVESIDLVPTFIEALGFDAPMHILEGRSLLPRVRHGKPVGREAAFSELDYATYVARDILGRGVNDCRAVMVRTPRWKYVHFDGYGPQLFDLENDPQELRDLGSDAAHATVRAEMKERIFQWMRQRKNRVAMDDDSVNERFEARRKPGSALIGRW
ncbi:MAG: alkaline phosphatase family protein [Burkholderiales bacterium]